MTEPASLVFNAPIDLAAGDIDLEQRNANLEEAARLFSEIQAPPGPLKDTLSELAEFLATAQQGPDGRPFDPDSNEYGALEARLIQACNASGEEFVVKGHGG